MSDTAPHAPGVLSGIRVLDCSIAMAGPFAAQRLGDLGADVIKVEPTTGEWQRHAPAGGARGNRINVSFLSLNRNKRSIAIDLKSEAGKDVLRDLVASSDVFLQNYRPGVAARLGVDYESLRAINPSIVYVSISGYGEDGPYRNRPGQDMLLQAMSGAMLSAGRAGEAPQAAGQYLVDAVTASTAFEAVLAALFHRERTGEGQLVTVNMLDVITTLQMQELSVFTAGRVPQQRSEEPHGHVYIRAPYGAFTTSDGFIALAMPELSLLGEVIGEPSFLTMENDVEGWTKRDEVYAKTAARLLTNTTEHWLAAFEAVGIWAGPVYDYAALVADEQIAHNGTFVEYDHPTEGRVKTPGFPYKFSKTPARVDRGAPLAGEHTREILADLGVDEARIAALLADGCDRAGAVGAMTEHRGITWDHPRGRSALEAGAALAQRHGGASIGWSAHSLEHFESHPIDDLAANYDLIVLDHPHLGEALAHGSLQPLDELFSAETLADWAATSIGPSYASYRMDGHQWAVPLDAATQVSASLTARVPTPPTTWSAVADLADHEPVALSLAGPHAFLTFASVCAAFGDPVAQSTDRFVSESTADAVLDLLGRIARNAPAGADELNPIRMLERMTTEGDIAHVPLIYGYVNYSSKELQYSDAPAWREGGVPGSTIGGTGLAVSRTCEVTPDLLAHVEWLMSDETQRRFIPVHDGQPSRRSAWTDPLLDAASHRFYSATVHTIEESWVRPRYDGFIAFQRDASAILRSLLLDRTARRTGLDALERAYRDSLAMAGSVRAPRESRG